MKTLESRISQVTTKWNEIFLAHGLTGDQQLASRAQQSVLRKYGKCIFRYLLGATRDPDVAEELAQEFAFRFVRGDLRNASPDRGRFRDYLRVVLRNLVNDYYRNQASSIDLSRVIQMQSRCPFAELEDAFRLAWRDEILASAWSTLETEQRQKDNSFYTVLRFRAQHPRLKSGEMATELSRAMERVVSADWVRQKLHRARERFGNLVLAEVRKTISPPEDLEQLREELADLQLLELLQVSHPELF